MQTNHRFPYPAGNPLMNENPDSGEGEWSIGDPLSEFSKLGTHLLPCSSDLPSPLCHSLLLGVISAESSRTEAPVGWGLWAFVVMLTRVIFLPCLSSGFAAREHVRSGFRQGSARSESSVLPDTSIKRVAAEVRGSSLLPRDGAQRAPDLSPSVLGVTGSGRQRRWPDVTHTAALTRTLQWSVASLLVSTTHHHVLSAECLTSNAVKIFTAKLQFHP